MTSAAAEPPDYPKARREDRVEKLHGVPVRVEGRHRAFPWLVVRRRMEFHALLQQFFIKTIEIVRAEFHMDGALLF